ncbi:MAG: 50S ribosomal protein L4 [Thermoplasmata archaeon]|nr:50S ribosomal protein L4 [Thermoplasmata archaeon]
MAEKKVKKIKAEEEVTNTTPGKLNVYDLEGKVTGETILPEIFKIEYRPDIIRRAVTAIEANKRQPYAPSPTAGMRHSVSTWGKGRGVSRVQRLMGSSTAAQSPNNVGGRRAHPPKVEKDLGKKINKKELMLGKLGALRATSEAVLVKARGHKFDEKLTVPIIVKDDFEDIKSTHEAVKALSSIGVYDDVQRAIDGKNIRAGRGKMRGRRYRIPKSLLVVVSKECKGGRSVRNLPGIDVVTPNALNASVLAPGGAPGRLMLVSESALLTIGGWKR